VGLTWRVSESVGSRAGLFHQDTAFFATSIRRVKSISGVPSEPSNRHNFESSTSVVMPSGANMNDDFDVASASASSPPPNDKKAIDASENDTDALYSDLFDKFQDEPLLPNQYN